MAYFEIRWIVACCNDASCDVTYVIAIMERYLQPGYSERSMEKRRKINGTKLNEFGK